MKQSLANNIQELKPAGPIEGVRVGTIAEITDGQPFVDFPGNHRGPLSARYTRSIEFPVLQQAASSQREVLLVFENNDPVRPIVIDILHSSLIDEMTEASSVELQVDEPKDVTVDGKRITFKAKEQIELRCGKASVTLTRAGKIIIRGAYLLNRSSGVNRIKGGSVQIN